MDQYGARSRPAGPDDDVGGTFEDALAELRLKHYMEQLARRRRAGQSDNWGAEHWARVVGKPLIDRMRPDKNDWDAEDPLIVSDIPGEDPVRRLGSSHEWDKPEPGLGPYEGYLEDLPSTDLNRPPHRSAERDQWWRPEAEPMDEDFGHTPAQPRGQWRLNAFTPRSR